MTRCFCPSKTNIRSPTLAPVFPLDLPRDKLSRCLPKKWQGPSGHSLVGQQAVLMGCAPKPARHDWSSEGRGWSSTAESTYFFHQPDPGRQSLTWCMPLLFWCFLNCSRGEGQWSAANCCRLHPSTSCGYINALETASCMHAMGKLVGHNQLG